MTLSQLKRQSELPLAPLLRRDLRCLGDVRTVTILFVTQEGLVREDVPAYVPTECVGLETPSECLPALESGGDLAVMGSPHLTLLNDMDVGEPVTLEAAVARGKELAEQVPADLVDIDF